MKTIQLTGDILNAFLKRLDPFDQSEVLMLNGSFALGATMETSAGTDTPAGIVIVCQEDERLVIRWIYVIPEYRSMGIGSHLLELVFEEAVERDLDEVTARISDRFTEAGLYWDTDSFFVNDIFKEYEEGFPELWFYAKDISKLTITDEDINEHAAGDKRTVPLSQAPAAVLEVVKKEMDEEFAMSISMPAEDLLSAADPDMSFVKFSGREFLGGIFVRKVGLTWFMYLLVSKDVGDMELLGRTAMYYSEDFVKPNDRVCIMPTRTESIKLANRIGIPFVSSDIHFITAYIDDYLIAKEKMARANFDF